MNKWILILSLLLLVVCKTEQKSGVNLEQEIKISKSQDVLSDIAELKKLRSHLIETFPKFTNLEAPNPQKKIMIQGMMASFTLLSIKNIINKKIISRNEPIEKLLELIDETNGEGNPQIVAQFYESNYDNIILLLDQSIQLLEK